MKYGFILFFTLAWLTAEAQETPKPEGQTSTPFFSFQNCDPERARFCNDKNGGADLSPCLLEHQPDLSPRCLQDIERYFQMRAQAAARGGGALSSFGGPNSLGPPIPLATYDGRYSPGKNGPPVVTKSGASISAPVHKSLGDSISVSLSGSDTHFGAPLVLDSGFAVPVDLYRMEVGSQYFQRLRGMKSLGLRASVGYAGDQPFQNSNDVTYSVGANYGFPGGSEKSYWVLAIYFSNNSPLGDFIPIPGVEYLYKTENFTGMFGFPVTSIQWTPVYPWSYSFSFFGPTVQTEIGYGTIEKSQVFAGAYFGMELYLPSQRANNLDRLVIQELRYGVGWRLLLSQSLLGELQAGWASNRYIYLGQSLFVDDGGETHLDDDWYLTWNLKLKL